MISPGEAQPISFRTDVALRKASEEFSRCPIFPEIQLPESLFTSTYTGQLTGEPATTLITSTDEGASLAVTADDAREMNVLFVNIDLTPDSPAMIVQPGILPARDSRGSFFTRTFVRLLTEGEGRGLIIDLQLLKQLHESSQRSLK